VQRQPDGRVLLQSLDHGQVSPLVGFGEDKVEIANGLMVVNGQGKAYLLGHRRSSIEIGFGHLFYHRIAQEPKG
jgi:hypothetical protein